MNLYDFKVKGANGDVVPMEQFKGKVLLIVNTATGCGFTPQYEGLQKLYDRHKGGGLEILDFPCNQFGHQAPGTDEEIGAFCTLKYKTTFPRFAKVDVNGDNQEPLFRFLKNRKGGFMGSNIKWNFTKFLVARDGNVVGRYAPTTDPEKIEKDILKLL
ncbi:MAG: glutathione peroxidase [Tidjanibacter sp.]|nr:glutathione peroxidase [Tidjanibacter sp.]MBR3854240.1 glutathione peroxidase [Tidjanibacter sp.]